MTISSKNVWAEPRTIGSNTVKQLLAPKTNDWILEGTDSSLELHGPQGRWPAQRTVTQPLRLTAALPGVPSNRESITWLGPRKMRTPEDVLNSWQNAIALQTPEESPLRRAQVGALHALLGYQTSGMQDPGLVVMPTGTGKTETMLAWMVATRPSRLLVLAPSDSLRTQLGERFLHLGILHRIGLIDQTALRPCVGILDHGIRTTEEAYELLKLSNVIIATPYVLEASTTEAAEQLLSLCTDLIVDEAHHAPAKIWSSVLEKFADKRITLFTATPYRSDKRALPGRMIYRYPLSKAQEDGVFSKFDFAMVPTIEDDDKKLAERAVERLSEDLSNGYDHTLLVRASNKSRAQELQKIYSNIAPFTQVRFLHDGLPAKTQRHILNDLEDGTCRVVVCVDMLGEGFDLPRLKVAAIHDPRRSLSPMVQLVGRLARVANDGSLGRASVFVKQDLAKGDSPLRELLREDADWNRLLNDVTEYATSRAEEVGEFNHSFDKDPSGVPVEVVQPKMSAVAFRTLVDAWDPDAARHVYGGRILDETISVSTSQNVAWFVLESRSDTRWARLPNLQCVAYDLVILYFDSINGILYIHGSDTSFKYNELAEAVLHSEPTQIRAWSTFRVFSGLDRVVPTNVGLLDSRDRDKRFSMYVGSSVLEALTEAEKQNKSQTHISASALEDGERVTISAAMSGRFWSMETAAGVDSWRDWCDRQGEKLIDESLSPHDIFKDMIIPVPVTERPEHALIAIEWPWQLYLGGGSPLRVTLPGHDGSCRLLDLGFEVSDYGTTGPFRFRITGPEWSCAYAASVADHGLYFEPASEEDLVVSDGRDGRTDMQAWISKNRPTLLLAGDRLITGDGRLYEPRNDIAPYDRSKLESLAWSGVDLSVESQGPGRRMDSIQFYMSQEIRKRYNLDLLIDDDGSGEAADLVGLGVDGDELLVVLVHCKYSSAATPGRRLADMYEVCGQVVRGARWRDHNAEPLLAHLAKRTQARINRGINPFDIGDVATLHKVRERARFLRPRFVNIIAQPGLSITKSSDEQMRVLAGAESYVRAVTKGQFLVFGSA